MSLSNRAKNLIIYRCGCITGVDVHSMKCIPVRPGHENVITLFFILGWDRYGFDKKRTGTHYAKHLFLHPVGYAGHVVHSDASGARNVDAFSSSGGPGAVYIKCAPGHVTPNLCFCILWDVQVT
jgi:hypothetical protein